MRKTAIIPKNECFEYWSLQDEEILLKGFIEAEIHVLRANMEAEQSTDAGKASKRAS